MAIREGSITVEKKLCSLDFDICQGDQVKWKLKVSNDTEDPKDVIVVDNFPDWLENVRWTTNDGRTGAGDISETVTLLPGQTLLYTIVADVPEVLCGAKSFTNCAVVVCGPCPEDIIYGLSDPIIAGKTEDLLISPPFSADHGLMLSALFGGNDPATTARIIDWLNCGGSLLDFITPDEITKEDLALLIQGEPEETVPGFPDVEKLFQLNAWKWDYDGTPNTIGSVPNNATLQDLADSLTTSDPFGGTFGVNTAEDGIILLAGDAANYTSLWNISADPTIECPFGQVTP